MIPIGTRVTVTEHIDGDDCPNVVTGLNRFERFLGVWSFSDDELEPACPTGDAAPEPTETPTNPVVMRFLTRGGATVELRTHRFTTRYTHQGRPHVGDPREVTGFVWECLGCGADGRFSLSFGSEYLPSERRQAREHTNTHATKCRSMPRPANT